MERALPHLSETGREAKVSHYHNQLALVLAIALLTPTSVRAAGARTGVEARHGEMTLLRDVNARPAYRPAPPGIAIIVDPTPTRELGHALGTGELSDDDFASLSTGNRLQLVQDTAGNVAGSITSHTVNGSLGIVGQEGGMVSGDGIGNALSAPLGAVGGTTRGMGNRIQGALSSFPLGQPVNNNGGRGP